MTTTVGSLLVALGLDSAEFKSGLTQAEKEFKRSARRIENIGKSMQNVGRNLSIAVTAPLVALGVAATREAMQARDAIAQVNAALASMGNASGKTAEDLKKTAKELQYLSTFDDDDILRKVTANMLTFGSVSGEAFDRAQEAAVNLSARLGQDLQQSAIMVGKALNDPILGLTAMRRVGIQFTADQEKMIKGMVKVGDIAGAQAVMLKELERQFGGAAKAARDAVPGSDMINKWNDFRETVGEALLKAFERIEPMLSRILDGFNKLSPGMQTAVVVGLALAAALGPVLYLAGNLVRVFGPFVSAIKFATATVNAMGVATTGWTVALASLRTTIVSLAATLAPWALALGVVASAIWLLTRRVEVGAEAAARLRDQQEKLSKVQERAAGIAMTLATATGRVRAEAIANARALRQETIQLLENARASLEAARAKALMIQGDRLKDVQLAAGATGGSGFGLSAGAGAADINNRRLQIAERELAAQNQAVLDHLAEVKRITGIINTPPPVVSAPSVEGAGSGGGSNRADRAKEEIDRTAEIERRFNGELDSIRSQVASAESSMAKSADERAELELRQLEAARRQTLRSLEADEDYSDAQKARVLAALDGLEEAEKAGIEFQRQAEAEREITGLADERHAASMEALHVQADLADTEAERKRLALAIFDAEEDYLASKLRAIELSDTINDHEKERARIALAGLETSRAGRRASVGRANETEVERYLRHLNKTPGQINEAVDSIKINGLENFNDELVDAMINFRSLGDTVKSVVKSILADLLRLQIQQAIIKPLAGALGLSVPGYAAGTRFHPGGLAIVGERGPELVSMNRGAQVIPNHELRGGGRVEIVLRDEMLDARIEGGAGVVLTRAYPAMRADTVAHISNQRRRA